MTSLLLATAFVAIGFVLCALRRDCSTVGLGIGLLVAIACSAAAASADEPVSFAAVAQRAECIVADQPSIDFGCIAQRAPQSVCAMPPLSFTAVARRSVVATPKPRLCVPVYCPSDFPCVHCGPMEKLPPGDAELGVQLIKQPIAKMPPLVREVGEQHGYPITRMPSGFLLYGRATLEQLKAEVRKDLEERCSARALSQR